MKPGSYRRDQILQGVAAAPDRAVLQHERRSAPRAGAGPGRGRPTVGECVGITQNMTQRGLAVTAKVTLDVGDSVPIKFAGEAVRGARIVWKRGDLMGLALSR